MGGAIYRESPSDTLSRPSKQHPLSYQTARKHLATNPVNMRPLYITGLGYRHIL